MRGSYESQVMLSNIRDKYYLSLAIYLSQIDNP
jgi:hypothetical protein